MQLFYVAILLSVICVGGGDEEFVDYNSLLIYQPSCPVNCTCSLEGPRLAIDCSERTNSSQLADEIDNLINASSSMLTDLTITNSPLTVVPRSICLAAHLTILNLDSNKLLLLPENCFSNLIKLNVFSAQNNQLTELQDGIFNGMVSLVNLNLANNKISKIGLHTFTRESNLTVLRKIFLESNELTALEPWPFIRGQLVPYSSVSLSKNKVSKFENELNWSFRCGMKPLVNVALHLENNKIGHIIDFLNAWNITGLLNIICLFGTSPISDLDIYFKDNPFVCDCLDFELYALVHHFQHIEYMTNLFCKYPPDLNNRKIMSIPLDEFVCDLSSPPCPMGCQCIKRPSNKTLVVTCPKLTSLPVRLPNTSYPPPYKAKYMLQFRGSALNTVDFQEYFNETISLDVSQSSVSNVTDEAWKALTQMSVIDLSGNNLTILSPVLKTVNSTFESLSLYDNPWRCECSDRWIRDWLVSLGPILQSKESVLCDSPAHVRKKSILSISDDEFCYDPELEEFLMILKIVVPTVMGSVLAVLAITTGLYRWRVKAFVHLRLHPFDVDECEGEDMAYDVFLSCAYEDSEVARRIMNRLERVADNGVDPADDDLLPPGGYRVCYHERDFRPGDLIMESIQRAIERSKRVVCLLTPDFVRSEYCMMEFRGAWSHHTRIKKRRLVVVKWPEVDFSSVTDQENVMDLKMFLSTHTYVDRGTMDWWHHLIYALTIHGLPQPIDAIPGTNDDVLIEAPSTEHLLAD